MVEVRHLPRTSTLRSKHVFDARILFARQEVQKAPWQGTDDHTRVRSLDEVASLIEEHLHRRLHQLAAVGARESNDVPLPSSRRSTPDRRFGNVLTPVQAM